MTTVSHQVLQEWLQTPKAKGCDLKALLSVSGIPWECYRNARSSISGEQLARLSVAIRRLLNDQFMGYGRELLYPALLDRVLIKILAQSKNLQELLSEWRNFYNLVQSTGTIVTGCNKDELVYRFKFNGPQRPGTHVWILDITMLKLQLFSWMIGREIRLNTIGFAEPAPACAGEYLALLQARIFFDQPQNFFTFDKAYLHYPVIRTVEECLDYKDHLPEDFFAIPGNDRCFTRLVERALTNMLKTELHLPRIDCVAEELSVSVRGLRRKLESEGESFQRLKDKVRYDLALRQLAQAETPVGDIAADLGFSGTEAFSRAFKTWADISPQEYRNRMAGVAER